MSLLSLPVPSPAPPVEIPESSGVTLRQLVTTLGPDLLTVVASPLGLDANVNDPVIHDAESPGQLRPGDLVLAVGVRMGSAAAVDLVRLAATAQAAGVIFKIGDDVPAQLVDAATAGSAAIVAIPADAEWGHVHAMLRSALASGVRSPITGGSSAAELAIGDLFGLANAVSAMVGGSVVIHDVRLRLLAYSAQDEATDDVRRDTILGRRAPDRAVELVRRAGVLRQLRQPGVAVDVFGPELPGMGRRLAIGVHAGDEQLGSIWVLEGDRALDQHAIVALREAAQMAALHLVRHMAHDDIVRRHRSAVVHDFLDGRLPAQTAAETLDLPLTASYVLLAVRLPEESEAGRDLHAERLLSLITAYGSTYRLRTAQMAVVDAIYILVPGERGDVRECARRLADYIISSAQRSWQLPLRVVLSETAQQLADAVDCRRVTDQVLRVSAELGRPLPDVVTVGEVQAACILDDLRTIAMGRPRWVASKLQQLVEHDDARGTGYIDILRAYLDCGGNMRAAAGVLGIHPNTYRYRLQRVIELTDWNLDDSDQRLVLSLQLRLGLLPTTA